MSDRVLVQGEGASIRVDGSGSTVRVVIRQNIATGGGGVTVHNDLAGRSVADAHPISAVSGLQAALDAAGGPVLSDAVPQPSGLADAGVAVVASRGDHVHAPPTAGQIGAVTSGEVDAAIAAAHLDGSQITTGTVPDAHIPSSIARDSEVAAAVTAHAGAVDPHGDRAHAVGLVDDLSGVTDAAAARSNLGLGALATLSAVSSAEIVDGTIVNADVGAGAAIALSKLAVDPLARANHTGTQAQSTVTNLVSDLAGKAATVHTHSGADLTSGTVGSARLGTGTADSSTFLRGDGTWAAPAVVHSQDFTQGFYVTGPGRSAASNTLHYLAVVGNQVWHPIWLAAGTYDRVAVCTTVAGTSTWRLGLDTATAGLRPGVNVLDAGVVDMSVTAGWLTLTVSFTVSVGGWFFARLKCETFTSAPTAYVVDGVTAGENSFIPGWPTIHTSLPTRQMCTLTATGAAAGPFGNPPAWGYQQSGARMYVRKAS